ncbi:MAG: hypothetical protein A3I61_00780 [Acidobacteria bacterium RIFCSPLOWO2_02_FULL_68_18]|nr:MAG: hypothetical protein A3I61_00780 [Acidobacteria bacterium RIFCSPLOWO2_02_FULL_68_18]OFW49438.1 MAG: hypothetical protein A3G77_02145 [Acidobacteria bacterium RIFCSPLOWO2_12_FULL_68_19]
MKCPKCHYLGFETGDRCKNCGYDFSLMAEVGPDERLEIDLDLREAAGGSESGDWLAQFGTTMTSREPLPPLPVLPVEERPEPPTIPVAPGAPVDTRLPLFTPAFDDGDDEPLVKVPPTPRPPLAVRRTPDTPRLRATPPPVRRLEPEREPTLQFEADDGDRPTVARPHESRVWNEPGVGRSHIDGQSAVSPAGPRLSAAAIDHLMLCGIDLAVVYFTLRMAGLPMVQWTTLPLVPLGAFLLLIKLSYFWAFTAVGGQTIGKMAAHIRVVGADDRPLDAALAVRRTLAGALSAALFGLGFLPALVGADRRALHDRVAQTRVIALRSA